MSNETGGILFLAAVASILINIVIFCFWTPEYNVTSGKQFILQNATYKCTKTNELKEHTDDR